MKSLKDLGISPAPWKVTSDLALRVMSASREQVADDRGMAASDVGVLLANIRLIAAAPELYEALREIVADSKCGLSCGLCGVDKCKLRRAVAILEKAGGKE